MTTRMMPHSALAKNKAPHEAGPWCSAH